MAMRMHHSDEFAGKKSFIYGPSTANIASIHSPKKYENNALYYNPAH